MGDGASLGRAMKRGEVRDIPTEVLLAKEDGMSRDCAVNLDHIQTVLKGKIGPLTTNLSPVKM
jgi:mRNA interferase MazF